MRRLLPDGGPSAQAPPRHCVVRAVTAVAVDRERQRCLARRVTRSLDVDYLVVGAGAMGMAFTEALVDHADVRVALVDRRHSVGGHWLDAYPFVRLHQASVFARLHTHIDPGLASLAELSAHAATPAR